MIDWDKLVKERERWIDHNFPDSPEPDTSILGMIEEMGELAHAHLKEEQNIRGESADHQEKAKDAVGDLTIYMLGILGHTGDTPLDRQNYLSITGQRWALRQLSAEVGRVALSPSVYYCERVIHCLRKYCELRDWSYEAIVLDTWAEVKKRDWIAYPESGVPA